LKGFVKCAGCGKNLTAGWSRGKGGQKFPYYWCWNSQCRNKTVIAREKIESSFYSLLCVHDPAAELIGKLPSIAARTWAARKKAIADTARQLNRRRTEQETLNTRLITAKLKGEITQNDFELMKFTIEAEMKKIADEIKALDSESSTFEELSKKKDMNVINFGHAWRDGTLTQKLELQKLFYPDGLAYSAKKRLL
jgi:site-specific DNA recombinase